jgi:hypothetical protein
MKTLFATLLATAASASFAAAPTATLNHDPATYRNLTQKAAADYKSAATRCNNMSGDDKEVCMAEAKAVRAHAEAHAVARYNNTAQGREQARVKLAEADYGVAKAKCNAMTGADKDGCMNNAKSVHTAALAGARSARDSADKCAQAAASAKTGCLMEQQVPVTAATGATTVTGAELASHTEHAAEQSKELAKAAVEKTGQGATAVAQQAESALNKASSKTRQAAPTAKPTTENVMDPTGAKTRDTADTVANKTDRATDNAGAQAAQKSDR